MQTSVAPDLSASEAEEIARLSFILDGPGLDSGSDVELFHELTKISRNTSLEVILQIRRYLTVERYIRQSNLPRKRYPQAVKFALSRESAAGELAVAMAARRSCRKYVDMPLPLSTLGDLLGQAIGKTRVTVIDDMDGVTIYQRPYPSGGGLYPIEFYPILLNIEDCAPTVCHYDAIDHRLDTIGPLPAGRALQRCLGDRSAFRNAAVAIVLTAVFARSTNKYGARGYRFALLEAGHAAQNICLAAEGRGLGTLVWGEYFDDELNDILRVDGVSESVVSLLFLGQRDDA